ncbi:MAG: acyltransferase family protein [Flavobacteriaceae bacterium]|nr:acyltransferase family protein [Flavobacteriaceae bacterium]
MKSICFGISKNDTVFLKGLAILLITLHNIIHRLPEMPVENEFSFHEGGGQVFFTSLFFKYPFDYFFSFLGHYGVQMFIFLSAYAFYLKKDEILTSKFWEFFFVRYKAILIPFSIGIITVSLLNVLLRVFIYPDTHLVTILNSFFGAYIGGVLHLLMLHPFLPDAFPGGLGPWWFISFILQFYLILPLLIKVNITLKNTVVIIFFSILGSFVISNALPEFKLYYTVFGHFPEIFLGFYSAKYLNNYKLDLKSSLMLFLTSFFILLVCNSNSYLWYFANIPAIISFYILFKFIYLIPISFLKKSIFFIGKISMYIFILNGITREFFIFFIKAYPNNSFIYVICLVLYLGSTIMLSYFLFKIQSSLSQKIKFKVNYPKKR